MNERGRKQLGRARLDWASHTPIKINKMNERGCKQLGPARLDWPSHTLVLCSEVYLEIVFYATFALRLEMNRLEMKGK